MENKNGQGIFYGVIGVATLVVAIIGATFAYFSATITPDNTTIAGNAASAASVSLTVSPIGSTNTGMIPLNLLANPGNTAFDTAAASQFANAMTANEVKGAKCKDSNDDNVCQIYSITIANGGSTAIRVSGSLTLTATNTNFKWALLTDDTATTLPTWSKPISAGSAGDVTVDGNTGGTGTAGAAAVQALTAAGGSKASATYYVLVWLEETGENQSAEDAGQDFTGTVTFSSVDASGNESGVTATFK